MKDVYTTTEVAKFCGVSFRTVIRWIERGELGAYKLPGRGDHRVPMTDLKDFMRGHNIPEPEEWMGQPRRILIAEDEAPMAKAIERVLRNAGYETVVASDGFLAGSLLHTFKPRLLTLDIRMPGIDGMGVLRFLQKQTFPFFTKILVVSGESDERLEEALKLGADGALAKPFSNEDLLSEVQRLLG
ncbi:response regulator [Hahella sp. CCB-MM4]|uniref:response regulator n=1 Tax=Hahella sp. (strain CCB-MM4) TaxID=1926491 RepID=UPI000B9C50E8|nr:response regulator [Hahella sp. CCB-MM4]OZG72746.1 response regulator [Hahella sp. CCB-MM4]